MSDQRARIAGIISLIMFVSETICLYMSDQYTSVDIFGRDIGVRPESAVPYPLETDFSHLSSDHHGYEDEYNGSYSRSHSRHSSRSRSRSSRRKTHRHDWEVPINPLSRKDDSEEEVRSRRHHRHHHRHHRHHRSSSRSSSRSRHNHSQRITEADKKERWGHELFIEKVILNPEPEPPRILTDIEIPQEKWISKAGGVAIFINRPTSASSYQGRKDYQCTIAVVCSKQATITDNTKRSEITITIC